MMTTAATVRPPKIATDANSMGRSGGEFFTGPVCLVSAAGPAATVVHDAPPSVDRM